MLLCPANSQGPETVTDPRAAAESKICIVQQTASPCTSRNAKARCSLRWTGAISQPPPVPKAQRHGATGWHEAAGTARTCRGPAASAAAGTSTQQILAAAGTRRVVVPCNVPVRATRPSARSVPGLCKSLCHRACKTERATLVPERSEPSVHFAAPSGSEKQQGLEDKTLPPAADCSVQPTALPAEPRSQTPVL